MVIRFTYLLPAEPAINGRPQKGLSNPAIARPIAAPVTTTRYEVKVSDQTGCSAYGTVVVALRNGLLEAEFSGPEVVCPG